jgi:serine/threonine-protein kinase
MHEDRSTIPPGTLLAGKFRIERQLGAGAMGAVYAIHHELTRHRRALKLLHADVREVPDIVRRFLNEASAAGRAGSAHLVETFDAGTLPSGEPYLVMELLEGETLTTLIERERMLDPALATELVAQAAEGIESAHGAGIVHRDLKPDNLFVTQRQGRPFVKILDFGVSKFATASAGGFTRSRAGAIYGSPAYMSPEQITGAADVDPRTDVFALGVVLYQSLTGALPFDAPSIEALSMRIVLGQPTPIETLRPGLPVALLSVVARALAPKREERFPSARALAEALGPFRKSSSGADASAGSSEPPLAAFPVLGLSNNPPPAGPRPLMIVLFALLALLLGGLTLVMSRVRAQPATALAPAIPNPSPAPLRSPPAVAPPIVLATTTDLQPAKPPGPAPTNRPHSSPAITTARPSAAAPIATPAAPAVPPSAQGLGLHQDNPFR